MALTRTRILVTGGAGFLGSHLCERLSRRATTSVRRQLFHRPQGQHRPSAGQSAFRGDAPRRDLPAVCRGGRDLQSRLPGLAGALPVRSRADHQDQRHRRHQHAGARQAGRRQDPAGLDQRGLWRPTVHPQTEDYCGNVNPLGPRACYERASAAPRRCSSITTASIGRRSRWCASSTPTVRACIRTTAASCRTSSSRRCGARTSPCTATAGRPARSASSTT